MTPYRVSRISGNTLSQSRPETLSETTEPTRYFEAGNRPGNSGKQGPRSLWETFPLSRGETFPDPVRTALSTRSVQTIQVCRVSASSARSRRSGRDGAPSRRPVGLHRVSLAALPTVGGIRCSPGRVHYSGGGRPVYSYRRRPAKERRGPHNVPPRLATRGPEAMTTLLSRGQSVGSRPFPRLDSCWQRLLRPKVRPWLGSTQGQKRGPYRGPYNDLSRLSASPDALPPSRPWTRSGACDQLACVGRWLACSGSACSRACLERHIGHGIRCAGGPWVWGAICRRNEGPIPRAFRAPPTVVVPDFFTCKRALSMASTFPKTTDPRKSRRKVG
jgi:hypothetical protein